MSRTLQGVLLQLAALALFVSMDALLKLMVAAYPVPQVMFFRFAASTILVTLGVRLLAGRLPWRSRAPLTQTIRSALLATANGALAVALVHVPLADATAVIFASPALTVALAALWLNERVSRRRWAGVAVGLAGVLVAIRPPFLTGEPLHPAMLILVVTAVANTLYQLLTRKLAGVDDPRTTFLHTNLAAAGLTMLVQPLVWQPVPAADLPWLAALGALGAAGHCLMVLAFARAPASVLAPMSYTQIVWAGLAGVLVFADWPDGWTLLGAAIIGAGGLLVAWPARRAPTRS